MGVGFPFEANDLASRGNLASADQNGVITDRRAGRLPTEKCEEICRRFLSGINVDGVKVFVQPIKDYRILVVFRGVGLDASLTDADPQREGVQPPAVKALRPEAQQAAAVANKFLEEARRRLQYAEPANSLVIRGFSKMVRLPSFQEVYQLDPAVVAIYPMYKGLAKLVIVDISLNRDQDNPQLIFESLNSTGRELSQADLIRNFMIFDAGQKKVPRPHQFFGVKAAQKRISKREGGVTKVVRDIFISGNTMSKAIIKAFSVEYAKAEELKRLYGLIIDPAEKEKALADGQKEPLGVSQALSAVVKDLVAEVHRSVDFYLSQGPERSIGKSVLMAGTAKCRTVRSIT
jgi:hypothetical protein